MTTITKREVKGTQGVNASRTKATATTNATAKPANGTAVPAVKAETAIPLHKATGKPQSIEDHIKYFGGLA